MTPVEFVKKWRAVELKERSASQEHFLDLCRLLGEPTPAEADPKGEHYCFERGAAKTAGGEGWADVWKRGHFGWEYKGKKANLKAALGQLQQYALALENPPLLVVCDMDRIEVHTNWTNTVSQVHALGLDDLLDADKRQLLKNVMSAPELLKPGQTTSQLTEKVAGEFAQLAERLRIRGHAAQDVAHFVNRLVFCMFAEDVGLLPNKMFTRMLDQARLAPTEFEELAGALFGAMLKGGRVGFERVDWFNGGLFDHADALPLEADDIELCRRAASEDWSSIDPSILGTLFERGLDPAKRAELGAHYTDRAKIDMIVEPVITRPLLAEWEGVKADIATILAKREAAKTPGARAKVMADAAALYRAFIDRLAAFRVLDPACGSGNFLYVSILALKDLEHRAGLEAEAMGLQREFPRVGPEAVLGIELNPYAAELARVTVWIGEIQWMRRNGFDVGREPILKPLDTIQCRDALLNEDGSAAVWPAADVIVGNPPFIGAKVMRSALGADYVNHVRAAYGSRLPGFSDFVTFWFEKAHELVAAGQVAKAGLVATNSIALGTNQPVMKALVRDCRIFEAWRDEPWTVDGAAVRVALVCFEAAGAASPLRLDGHTVAAINADLTGGLDLTRAGRLTQNAGVAFNGIQKTGPFEVDGSTARTWLEAPLNPNGRPNADVVRPWFNGLDVTRRPRDMWIVDFGADMAEADAALYELPFKHCAEVVRPAREDAVTSATWWTFHRARPQMRRLIRQLDSYIATPEVSKHRIFVMLDTSIVPDKNLVVIARGDFTTLGILHSRFHEAWALRLGTTLEDRPRYTPSTIFETFPFPDGLTPDVAAAAIAADPRAQAIAAAAKRLDELRRNWLNPADLVTEVAEVVPGLPPRLLPKDETAARLLSKRTLTALYNERPAWLTNAHTDLDAAVAAAYGWPADVSTGDALAALLALNISRAQAQA